MSMTQLAVFLENKAGRLAEVTGILGDAGVNIRGFSVADTAEYGILRLIVDQPELARDELKRRSFTVHRSHVLCIRVPHRPGGLAEVLVTLGRLDINVEYMYPIGDADIVFGVEEAERAKEALKDAEVTFLDQASLLPG
jgi:hypothetical protein